MPLFDVKSQKRVEFLYEKPRRKGDSYRNHEAKVFQQVIRSCSILLCVPRPSSFWGAGRSIRQAGQARWKTLWMAGGAAACWLGAPPRNWTVCTFVCGRCGEPGRVQPNLAALPRSAVRSAQPAAAPAPSHDLTITSRRSLGRAPGRSRRFLVVHPRIKPFPV